MRVPHLLFQPHSVWCWVAAFQKPMATLFQHPQSWVRRKAAGAEELGHHQSGCHRSSSQGLAALSGVGRPPREFWTCLQSTSSVSPRSYRKLQSRNGTSLMRRRQAEPRRFWVDTCFVLITNWEKQNRFHLLQYRGHIFKEMIVGLYNQTWRSKNFETSLRQCAVPDRQRS